jgi:hypothetical protein
VNKTETLSKVIEDALLDSTKPKERLAIYKALSEILDDLGRNLQIESQASKAAHEFLKRGPVTRYQESRLRSETSPDL